MNPLALAFGPLAWTLLGAPASEAVVAARAPDGAIALLRQTSDGPQLVTVDPDGRAHAPFPVPERLAVAPVGDAWAGLSVNVVSAPA